MLSETFHALEIIAINLSHQTKGDWTLHCPIAITLWHERQHDKCSKTISSVSCEIESIKVASTLNLQDTYFKCLVFLYFVVNKTSVFLCYEGNAIVREIGTNHNFSFPVA